MHGRAAHCPHPNRPRTHCERAITPNVGARRSEARFNTDAASHRAPSEGMELAGDGAMPSAPADFRRLTVAVVTPDPSLVFGDEAAEVHGQGARAAALVQGLRDAGCELVALLPAGPDVDARIVALQPDVLIVEAESGVRDLLEHVVFVSRETPRPIVMFTDDNDPETARMAIAAGVTAYIVDGLKAARVKLVIDVALARFAREQDLRAELDKARKELSERKIIDRAKGIVMQRLRIGEDEAFARMRRQAMEKGLRLADIARRILDAADLI